MDDLDLALRSRLRSLADAVPVAEMPLERVRRQDASGGRRARFAPLAAAVVVVVAAAVTLSILGRSSGPATTPTSPAVPFASSSPSASPAAPATASPTPEPASEAPASTAVGQLKVELLVESECPQVGIGRCRYSATVTGPDGTTRRLPIPRDWTNIGPGTYRIDFTAVDYGGEAPSRSPVPGTTAASCAAVFSAPEMGPRIRARIVVRGDGCLIDVFDAQTPVAPDAPPPPTDVNVRLPYPEGCASYGLSPWRCAYIADQAIEAAGVTGKVAMVELLGDPDCVGKVANCNVRFGGGIFVVRVRVTPAGDVPTDSSVYCDILNHSPSCTETPRIEVLTPMEGYLLTPCDGTGSTCASPAPTLNVDELPNARPLTLTDFRVPLVRAGSYTVDVGDAILASGILIDARATLADPTRTDVLIPEGIRLEVIGEDGQPIENVYTHAWRAGVEHVHVQLVFTVEAFDPGTTLVFSTIAVR